MTARPCHDRRVSVTRRLAMPLLVLALAGWEPFRAPNPDVEAGNQAFVEGWFHDAAAWKRPPL